MADFGIDAPADCRDPECPYPQPSAQPELDGDWLFYACPCGYEFPGGRIGQAEGTCAAGVPEAVRRAASVKPLAAPPVFLGTTIGRRPQ